MSLYRSGNRGSYILERTFKGVGMVRRATGLEERADAEEFERLLVRLARLHRQELIKAFRDRLLAGDELYRAYQRDGIDGLPSIEHIKPLAEAVETWLAAARLAPRTRRDYREAFDTLLALEGPEVSVARLPALLRMYRERAGGGRSFNKVRATARSFASSLTGRYRGLWVDLTNVRPRPVRTKLGNPQTPDEARAKAAKLGPRHGAMWWTLCCTGMSGGPEGPYFLDVYDVLGDRLLIHGTKTEGRERVVPRLCTPVRKLTEYQAFQRAMSKVGLRPNDGRKTFAHWLEEAGIRRTMRRRLLGHGRRDVTDVYEDFPIEKYLGEIAQRMRAYIGDDWQPALEVMA